jgi:hypothetical protein
MTAVHRAGAALAASLLALALVSAILLGCGHAARFALLGPDCKRLDDERTELDHQRERLNLDIEVSDHLVTRLATGTISLADATAQMEPRLQERAGFRTVCEVQYQVPDTYLGTARYLIEKVARFLEADPSHQASVSARLEAEYAAMQ